MGEKEDLSDAFSIRRDVFVGEQNLPHDAEFTGDEDDCLHLVMYDDGVPVATGRILIGDGDFKIGRVATRKSHRGRGIATNIVQTLIGACHAMGGNRQYVHARVDAKNFYEKLGFVAFGEEVVRAGVPHIAMERFGSGGCGGGEHCGNCGRAQ